jgi:hypothetical protein
MAHTQIVNNVMAALEKFYDDGSQSGEDMFNTFAAEHASLFSKDSDATTGENKLEWTAIHEKFCKVFEAHIESNKDTLYLSNLLCRNFS